MGDYRRTRMQLNCVEVPEVLSVSLPRGREAVLVSMKGSDHDYAFTIPREWVREFASNLTRAADEFDAKTIVDV